MISTITIDGGGKQFVLTTDITRTSTFAVAGVQAARLGGVSGTLDQIASGGSAGDLGANTAEAIRIVDEALADLTIIEGSVDGFANASIAAASALTTAIETDLGDAIDGINKVDDAAETLLLARNQALAANASTSLSILATEESRMIVLLQQIAGLI